MTSSMNIRKLLAECAIGVSICAAGYIFLVDPTKQELVKVQGQITSALREQGERSGVSALSEAQIADLRRLVADRVGQIKARSEQSRDQATLFGGIMALGAAHQIQVDQLQPGTTTIVGETPGGTPTPKPVFQAGAQGASPDPSSPTPAEPPKPRDVRTTCTLTIQGSFANITSFLTALQNELGYTNILDVRLSPSGESATRVVSATIQTEHFAFDLSSVQAPAVKTSIAASAGKE